MLGYQIIKLIVISSPTRKQIRIPQLNDFKIILNGSAPESSHIDILLEAEGINPDEIEQKLENQLKKLNLYLNLFSDNTVGATPRESRMLCQNEEQFNTQVTDNLDDLVSPKLPNYLNARTTQQHVLLQQGLGELQRDDIFNAFPKFVNWLDENDFKGSSRFCSVRDSCSHGSLGPERAFAKINELFPEEFEFEEYILKRDSTKNKESLKKHIPELLEHVKQIFKIKFVDSLQ